MLKKKKSPNRIECRNNFPIHTLFQLMIFPFQDIQHLSPATDFYKKLALDCSGQQVAVDLFLLSSQYCDLASLGKFQAP